MALLEKAAGQGHAYAMFTLGAVHFLWNEHEEAVRWYTKSAEAGLPKAMFNLGRVVQVEPMKPTLKAPGPKRLETII